MKKYVCENCGKEHNGSYGSGRFCSKKCRGQFCAKGKKTGIKRKDPWICDYCLCEFDSRSKLFKHKHEIHKIKRTWNKGKTKVSDSRLMNLSKKMSNAYKTGKYSVWCKGKHLSKEMKQKISASMIKAHIEGRAHNIGQSRWNNLPSYPEKWFMNVIQNEFEDKNYFREYPFHQFSLDFAWIHKKKCIEIDGAQHQRFVDIKERDKRKDIMLNNEGWQVLRLIWKDVYNNPKKYIQLAKDFLKQ